MSKNNRRSSTFWGKVIALVLVICTLFTTFVTAVGFFSEGFSNADPTTWFEKDNNPDNLIQKANYIDSLIDESEKGLKMDWKDDGSVVLSGKHDDTSNDASDYYTYAFVNVTLPEGTYVLSTGNKNCREDLFGLHYKYGSGENFVQDYVGEDDVEIVLTEETTITISIFAANKERFWGINSYIRPILVEKGNAVEFYK